MGQYIQIGIERGNVSLTQDARNKLGEKLSQVLLYDPTLAAAVDNMNKEQIDKLRQQYEPKQTAATPTKQVTTTQPVTTAPAPVSTVPTAYTVVPRGDEGDVEIRFRATDQPSIESAKFTPEELGFSPSASKAFRDAGYDKLPEWMKTYSSSKGLDFGGKSIVALYREAISVNPTEVSKGKFSTALQQMGWSVKDGKMVYTGAESVEDALPSQYGRSGSGGTGFTVSTSADKNRTWTAADQEELAKQWLIRKTQPNEGGMFSDLLSGPLQLASIAAPIAGVAAMGGFGAAPAVAPAAAAAAPTVGAGVPTTAAELSAISSGLGAGGATGTLGATGGLAGLSSGTAGILAGGTVPSGLSTALPATGAVSGAASAGALGAGALGTGAAGAGGLTTLDLLANNAPASLASGLPAAGAAGAAGGLAGAIPAATGVAGAAGATAAGLTGNALLDKIIGLGVAGGLPALGAILGTNAQTDAAKEAAKAQQEAAKYQTDAILKMYEQARSDYEPYRLAGTEALGQLQGYDLTGASQKYIDQLEAMKFQYPEITTDITGGSGKYLTQLEALTPPSPNIEVKLDENDPIYKWKQEEAAKAVNQALAARGLYNSRPGINALSEAAMKVSSEEADKAYSRAVDEYNRAYQSYAGTASQLQNQYTMGMGLGSAEYQKALENYNRAKGEYGMKYGQLMDLYNMSNQLGQQQYGQLLDLTKIGAGAAGQAGQTSMSAGGQLASVYGQLGQSNALSQLQQGSSLSNLYAGLGTLPLNALLGYGYGQQAGLWS